MIDKKILVVIIFVSLTRIIYVLVSKTLFSVDIWPIYWSSKILSRSSIPLYRDDVFDGYTNKWPGELLVLVVFSKVLRLDIFHTFLLLHVLLYMVIAYTLYMLIRTLTRCKDSSIAGVIYYSYTPSILVFTSALLKEVYSLSLLLLLLYLYVKGINGEHRLRVFIVSLMIFSGLVLSHVLLPFLFLGIALSMYYTIRIRSLKKGDSLDSVSTGNGWLYLILVFSIVYSSYILFYGLSGLPYKFSINDFVSYLLYACIIYGSYLLLPSSKHYHRRITIIVLLVGISILLSGVFFFHGIVLLSTSIWYYALPVLLSLALIGIYRGSDNISDYFVTGMALFLLLNIAYTSLGNPLFSAITHRFLNYAILLVAVVSSILYSRKSVYRYIVLLLVCLSIASSIVTTYRIITGDDKLSYYWFYRLEEVKGFNTIYKLLPPGLTVIGDDKVYYYYWRRLHVNSYLYIRGVYGSENISGIPLILYRENSVHGLMINLNTYPLHRYYDKYSVSKVFDNNYAYVVVGYD